MFWEKEGFVKGIVTLNDIPQARELVGQAFMVNQFSPKERERLGLTDLVYFDIWNALRYPDNKPSEAIRELLNTDPNNTVLVEYTDYNGFRNHLPLIVYKKQIQVTCRTLATSGNLMSISNSDVRVLVAIKKRS